MPITLLPSLLFALFAVGYSPGPANLYSLACCLKFGRRKALKMWRFSGQSNTEAQECTFTSGMIVQLTNAKMLLFELTAFSVYVLPYSDRIADLFVVAALLLIAGPGANLVWLYAGAYLRRFFAKYQKQVDIVMAILLALCAIYIIII